MTWVSRYSSLSWHFLPIGKAHSAGSNIVKLEIGRAKNNNGESKCDFLNIYHIYNWADGKNK